MNDSIKLCVFYDVEDFNFSLTEVFKILEEHTSHVRNVSHTTEIVLIFVYSLLIISGLFVNLVVSFVVARKTQMHTPRNLYIVNLTASDMSLCLVCMPFTLVSVVQRHWNLGLTLCKIVPALQGANILVSVGTITVIALDRYFTIVLGQDGRTTKRRVVVSIIVIWVASALAISPLLYYTALVPVSFQSVALYEKCVECWPSQKLKMFYTSGILLVQAVIPTLVIGAVHVRIARHLHQHTCSLKDERRAHREVERNRRTTILLSLVTLLFALSWLPLGIFSLIVDLLYPPETSLKISSQNLYVAFAICHVIAMSSAVSNPVLYGWLNSNIRKEFLQLLQIKCTVQLGEDMEMVGYSRSPGLVVPNPKTTASVTTKTVPEGGAKFKIAKAVYHYNGIKPSMLSIIETAV